MQNSGGFAHCAVSALAAPPSTRILGEQKFRAYAEQWMRDRVLKARSAELYDGLLSNHLLPTFGELSVSDIDEAAVRRWAERPTERVDSPPSGNRAIANSRSLGITPSSFPNVGMSCPVRGLLHCLSHLFEH